MGDVDVPISQSGEVWINWPTRNLDQAFPTYSAIDVLRGDVGTNELSGKAVLVGLTAVGLNDREFPFGWTLPGVILPAAFLDNFFTRNFLETPRWSRKLELMSFVILALVTMNAFPRMHIPVLLSSAPVSILAVLALSLYLFISKSVWWPPLYPCLAITVPFVTTVLFRLLIAEERTEVEAEKAREAKEQLTEAVLEKGLAFQEKGSLDLALATFATLPLSERMKIIYLNLGIDFQNRLKHDKAFLCYKKVHEVDPEFEDVATRIDALREAGVGAPDVLRPKTLRVPGTPILPQAATNYGRSDASSEDEDEAATTERAPVSRSMEGVGLQPGTPSSRYRIVRTLGAGAMGMVTLMEDTKLERRVAVKMMRPDVAMSAEQAIAMRHRFIREAKTAAKLTHPNIVTIYDSFEGEDGVAYIVMEYVEGDTLRGLMDSGPLPVSQIKHVVIDAANGLNHAHENGFFHRDVKPENLMVSRKTGVVKVMDFGIVSVADSSMTTTGGIIGTPAYMSPEQVNGQRVDGRSDVFSLGVVLFEMLVGERPFTGSSPTELMFSIVQTPPSPPSSVDPARGVSAEWDSIVLKAIAKAPELRFQSAKDLAEAVRQCSAN